MNLDLSFDGVSVSTDPEDAELARHAKATAESVRDLATYVVGEGRQQCHNCGKTRPCRPLALQDDHGQPVQAPICAGCQAEFVEARVEQARQQPPAEDKPEYVCPNCGNDRALTVSYEQDRVVGCPECHYEAEADPDA